MLSPWLQLHVVCAKTIRGEKIGEWKTKISKMFKARWGGEILKLNCFIFSALSESINFELRSQTYLLESMIPITFLLNICGDI